MIMLGGDIGGPDSPFEPLYWAAKQELAAALSRRDLWKSRPGIDIVMQVPGRITTFDDVGDTVRSGHCSKREQLVQVLITVPGELADRGEGVEFVVESLRAAVTIASDVFRRKGVLGFDAACASEVIDEVGQGLKAQGFK